MFPSVAPLSDATLLERVFPAGGDMGARMRQLDWAATPLGPVRHWPQSLRTAVGIMLGSRFPMMVHWGPELVHFYNDGYATILQGKHPGALGQPAEPWWREMWPFLQQIFTPVLAGQTTYFENSLVLPNRQGFVEEAYFTFSHSPIYVEDGTVGGIFVTALETTATVLQHRRLAQLSQLTAHTTLTSLPAEAAQHLMAALATNLADLPFALLYTRPAAAEQAELRAWFGLPAGEPAAPATVAVATPDKSWPLAQAWQQRTPLLVDLAERFASWPLAGEWPVPPAQALLLPLPPQETSSDEALLVLGLSARRPLDADYQAFCTLVADYAGRALARAAALHEAQRLNQSLRELNASLDSFVHLVAHDLRGPLTNLHGLLDVYTQEVPGPAREHVIELFGREMQHLSGTVQGLLQVLELQYEAPAAAATLVNWVELMTQVQPQLADLLHQQQGTLLTDFAAAPTIAYPHAYLVSIMYNLVSNALKYRAPDRPPLVQVHTRREGATTVLTVRDNGRGIDLARDGERLFQPFTRLTADGEGAGLGLHMLRTLVQQRGGTLAVASTPGVGTTFTLRLRDTHLASPE